MFGAASPKPCDHLRTGWLSLPHMRYPDAYAWFLLFSSMDIMLTWVILHVGGLEVNPTVIGSEVNPVARWVIDMWDLPGAIGFKFSLTVLVIIVCEIVGRRKDRKARKLAQFAVIVSALPVIYSLGLLALHVATMEP